MPRQAISYANPPQSQLRQLIVATGGASAIASIVWSRDGRAFLRGRITFIGSVDTEQQTWLWSWAGSSVPQAALGDIENVRRFGEEHNFPLLVWPSFEADRTPVNQSTMVALDVLGAEGLWRDRAHGVEMVFAVHDLQASRWPVRVRGNVALTDGLAWTCFDRMQLTRRTLQSCIVPRLPGSGSHRM